MPSKGRPGLGRGGKQPRSLKRDSTKFKRRKTEKEGEGAVQKKKKEKHAIFSVGKNLLHPFGVKKMMQGEWSSAPWGGKRAPVYPKGKGMVGPISRKNKKGSLLKKGGKGSILVGVGGHIRIQRKG